MNLNTLLVILALISNFNRDKELKNKSFPYDLTRPEILLPLPEILTEISGLTDVDENHIACVQDELGEIFIYNIEKAKIVKSFRFGEPGDFEGLTRVGDAYFVLRSDGRLSEVLNFNTVHHQQLPLVTADNEGLCYDPEGNRLLIAAKSKPINHDWVGERLIYSYDLRTKKLKKKPAFSLNIGSIKSRLPEFGLSHLLNDTTSKGTPKAFNFRPSSLAVHPFSKNIYIISSSDKLLIVIDRSGLILHIESMHHEKFTKPEGITFLDDGTMIITNEAAGKKPSLIQYKMFN